jgi:putative transposase
MPQGLKRFHQSGQSHFVTFSCYHRRPNLTGPEPCRIFLEALEAARKRFAIRIYGYVLMPEHVHLLLSEPTPVTLAEAIHFVKSSSGKRLCCEETKAFWQPRYYDRNIRDYHEFVVKLRYLHRNPVKRGLCLSPEQWPWKQLPALSNG